MFDEVDEGTAMYKMVETTSDLPLDADQVPLNEDGYDLPSDWYLQVGKEIQKMLEGSIPLTQDLPLTPPTAISAEEDLHEPLRVYPVPAGDVLYIGSSNVEGAFNIISIDGLIVLQGVFNNNSIRTNNLDSGMYFLQLNGRVIRFVKE